MCVDKWEKEFLDAHEDMLDDIPEMLPNIDLFALDHVLENIDVVEIVDIANAAIVLEPINLVVPINVVVGERLVLEVVDAIENQGENPDWSRYSIPQYQIDLQRFDLRRQSVENLSTLFDQWLNRQVSHIQILHFDSVCDQCHNNFEQLQFLQPLPFGIVQVPFMKHITSCDHSICSVCLSTKRFIFTTLGLPICCNVCTTCWLYY